MTVSDICYSFSIYFSFSKQNTPWIKSHYLWSLTSVPGFQSSFLLCLYRTAFPYLYNLLVCVFPFMLCMSFVHSDCILKSIPICLCKCNSIFCFTEYIYIYLLLYCHYTNRDWFQFRILCNILPIDQEAKIQNAHQYEKLKLLCSDSPCILIWLIWSAILINVWLILLNLFLVFFTSFSSLGSTVILCDLNILAAAINNHNFPKIFLFLCATRNKNFRKKFISSYQMQLIQFVF